MPLEGASRTWFQLIVKVLDLLCPKVTGLFEKAKKDGKSDYIYRYLCETLGETNFGK